VLAFLQSIAPRVAVPPRNKRPRASCADLLLSKPRQGHALSSFQTSIIEARASDFLTDKPFVSLLPGRIAYC
jgi:hypothetical protein